MWSIYLAQNESQGELADMLSLFPQAAIHDATNYIFVATHPKPANPIIVSELGAESTEDLVPILARLLFATDRTRAIHLTKQQAIALHSHPAWKLWCASYDDWRDLENDYETVFHTGVDGRKPIDELNAQARESIRQWGESL